MNMQALSSAKHAAKARWQGDLYGRILHSIKGLKIFIMCFIVFMQLIMTDDALISYTECVVDPSVIIPCTYPRWSSIYALGLFI